jgi:hypothetical protein
VHGECCTFYSCVILGPSQYRPDGIAVIAHTSAFTHVFGAPWRQMSCDDMQLFRV